MLAQRGVLRTAVAEHRKCVPKVLTAPSHRRAVQVFASRCVNPDNGSDARNTRKIRVCTDRSFSKRPAVHLHIHWQIRSTPMPMRRKKGLSTQHCTSIPAGLSGVKLLQQHVACAGKPYARVCMVHASVVCKQAWVVWCTAACKWLQPFHVSAEHQCRSSCR